jgi:hypothetical protein
VNQTDPTRGRDATPATGGFRVSDQPIVQSNRPPSVTAAAELPKSYGADLLCVIARDPKSLFLYWDLDWPRLFAKAEVPTRQVHLRIFRDDGSIEATTEINPSIGHCYAQVSGPGTRYYCELGAFEGDAWKCFARSRTTATPNDKMSDDLRAEFARLPLHLSFQRLLDLFWATETNREMLASSIAQLQEKAQALRDSMAPDEWALLVKTAAASMEIERFAELAAILQTMPKGKPQPAATAEMLAQWRRLGERFGGVSRGGASSGGFGGSGPA